MNIAPNTEKIDGKENHYSFDEVSSFIGPFFSEIIKEKNKEIYEEYHKAKKKVVKFEKLKDELLMFLKTETVKDRIERELIDKMRSNEPHFDPSNKFETSSVEDSKDDEDSNEDGDNDSSKDSDDDSSKGSDDDSGEDNKDNENGNTFQKLQETAKKTGVGKKEFKEMTKDVTGEKVKTVIESKMKELEEKMKGNTEEIKNNFDELIKEEIKKKILSEYSQSNQVRSDIESKDKEINIKNENDNAIKSAIESKILSDYGEAEAKEEEEGNSSNSSVGSHETSVNSDGSNEDKDKDKDKDNLDAKVESVVNELEAKAIDDTPTPEDFTGVITTLQTDMPLKENVANKTTNITSTTYEFTPNEGVRQNDSENGVSEVVTKGGSIIITTPYSNKKEPVKIVKNEKLLKQNRKNGIPLVSRKQDRRQTKTPRSEKRHKRLPPIINNSHLLKSSSSNSIDTYETDNSFSDSSDDSSDED